MANDQIDPLDEFARKVRGLSSDGRHAIVGPPSSQGKDDPNRYLIEVAVAAAQPTPESPFVCVSWHFEAGAHDGRGGEIWDMWTFLAKLLERDFEAVERYGNQLEFARAVENRWPSATATAARERLELQEHRCQEWEVRRGAYIAKRVQEGLTHIEAMMEFEKLEPYPG